MAVLTEELSYSSSQRQKIESALGVMKLTSTKKTEYEMLTEKYITYKKGFLKHFRFDPEGGNLCKCINFVREVEDGSFSASLMEHAPLEAVYIFFDSATFDEIERDVKVTHLNDGEDDYNMGDESSLITNDH